MRSRINGLKTWCKRGRGPGRGWEDSDVKERRREAGRKGVGKMGGGKIC